MSVALTTCCCRHLPVAVLVTGMADDVVEVGGAHVHATQQGRAPSDLVLHSYYIHALPCVQEARTFEELQMQHLERTRTLAYFAYMQLQAEAQAAAKAVAHTAVPPLVTSAWIVLLMFGMWRG